MRDQTCHKRKPIRFGLKELLIGMTLACMVLGVLSWSIRIGMLTIAFVGVVAAWRTRRWVGLAVSLVFGLAFIATFVLPGARIPHGHQPRTQCWCNVRSIALALQSYHDTYGSFPPSRVDDERGRPAHSWRVLILPFLGERKLYDRYSFEEPWDGPRNRKLWKEIPDVYQCIARKRDASDYTTDYVAVTGANTIWAKEARGQLDRVLDNEPDTVLVVEAANSQINWMEPRDLDIARLPMTVNPPSGVGIASMHGEGAHCVCADGTIIYLERSLPAATIRDLLTWDSGQ